MSDKVSTGCLGTFFGILTFIGFALLCLAVAAAVVGGIIYLVAHQ